MKTEHTPGPWIAQRDPANGKLVAHAPWNRGNVATINPIQESSDANARLIAAAPDLLAALRGCLTALDVALDRSEGDTFGVHHNSAMDAMDDARAAIEKATKGT